MKFIIAFSLLFSFSSFAAVTVVMETTKGNIEIELNDTKAPITVKNFLTYVDEGFFPGTLFHRVVKKFVIQGGGVLPDFSEKETHAPIINEANNGLSNLRGTIAMARTSVIDSATSQFYINTVDNVRLDYQSPQKYGYAVFGKVTKGLDIVDAIEKAETHTVGEYQDTPIDQIVILKVTRK